MKLSSAPSRAARLVAQALLRKYAVRDNVSLGKRVHIGLGSTLWAPDHLTIGDDVYIGKRCTIEVNGSIGRGSLIANNVGLVGRNDHDYTEVGSYIRDAAWIGDPEVVSTGPKHRIEVGEDCWIGFGACVLSGVVIGRGAIVSAGAVVTHDVESYSIVAGVPARIVGERFTSAQRQQHEKGLKR